MTRTLSITFYIPHSLRAYTKEKDCVVLNAAPATVWEALELLWSVYPGIRDRVVTEQGEVRPHVNIFVGEENIRDADGLKTPVPANAEITIVPAVSGG